MLLVLNKSKIASRVKEIQRRELSSQLKMQKRKILRPVMRKKRI
jgi:hypothetical protein